MIPSTDATPPIPSLATAAACPRRGGWFCPLRLTIFGQLFATLVTVSGLAFVRLEPGLAATNPGLVDAIEGAGLVAALAIWAAPPSLLLLAWRRGVDRREMLRLTLATVGLATVQVLAVLASVR